MRNNVDEEKILNSFVEVKLGKDEEGKTNEAFLKIRETLTRIGIASRKENILYQSCHILSRNKKSRYYIVHFLEMFELDGKETHFSEEDKKRRNTIVSLLEEWGLLKVVDKEKINDQCDLGRIKVLPYSEKSKWKLCAKYNIGK